MMMLFAALVFLVCLLVFINVQRLWPILDARRRGKLPKKGKATMFDVRHLLMEGDKELAIQLYCEIFNTTPTKARKDVSELERSLKV